ncbi:MAG: AbiJ-NTD4 domain-containing protein, partial [Rhodoferax sp.]
MSDYFSDRENGPRACTEQVFSPAVWAGLVGTVQALVNGGAFGLRFPERCPDGQAVCGCDPAALAASVIAEMPGLAWPLETTHTVENGFFSRSEPFAPDTLLVLDFMEFVHAAVAKPIPGKHHDYFNHDHLTFDQVAGQEEFRKTINRIFARNGVAFEMLSTGRIVRILPPLLGESLKRTAFNSGDRTLDNMLEECRTKFSDRNPLVRREALERLWDAWERLKSLADPGDKKKSIKILLDSVASEPSLRSRLEAEAIELTAIGNSHLIRHSEVNQVPVIDVNHV